MPAAERIPTAAPGPPIAHPEGARSTSPTPGDVIAAMLAANQQATAAAAEWAHATSANTAALAAQASASAAVKAMLAAAGPQLFQYSDGSFAVYQADSTHPDGFSILTPSVAVPTGGAPGPGWPPGQVIIEG